VTVRITVLGCSGSVVGPDSPASGYLLRAPDTPPLVIDFGGGVLGALQRHADPGSVHVLLSHLHADHCLDMPGLFVWRRYHPSPPKGKALLYGPSDTWSRLGAASSPFGGEIDDCSDIFDVHHWVDGEVVTIGALNVVPKLVCHPTESYGMRITNPAGSSFVYSGDTGYCETIIDLARDADVFLCEASWTHAPGLGTGQVQAGRAHRERCRGGGVVVDPHPAVDLAGGCDQRGQGGIRRPGARGGVRRDIQRRALLSC
jgi:ribonuclease BN (tRNA processing enzyme)